MSVDFINEQLKFRGIPLEVSAAPPRRNWLLNEYQQVTVDGIIVDALSFSEFLLEIDKGDPDAIRKIQAHIKGAKS